MPSQPKSLLYKTFNVIINLEHLSGLLVGNEGLQLCWEGSGDREVGLVRRISILSDKRELTTNRLTGTEGGAAEVALDSFQEEGVDPDLIGVIVFVHGVRRVKKYDCLTVKCEL